MKKTEKLLKCLIILKKSKIDYNLYCYYNYSFSKIAAAPIPVPIHIEIQPNFLFVLISSCMRVATYLAPVHPSGCPKAIAPPFGLTFL